MAEGDAAEIGVSVCPGEPGVGCAVYDYRDIRPFWRLPEGKPVRKRYRSASKSRFSGFLAMIPKGIRENREKSAPTNEQYTAARHFSYTPSGVLRHMDRAHWSIEPGDVTNCCLIGLYLGSQTRESWPSKHGC